ncbi:hypothetical protein DEU35_3191 [Microbacterium sp. AG157]|nr:hypothetical protein DEU35_3191 [Microbacterium sp. AG157]
MRRASRVRIFEARHADLPGCGATRIASPPSRSAGGSRENPHRSRGGWTSPTRNPRRGTPSAHRSRRPGTTATGLSEETSSPTPHTRHDLGAHRPRKASRPRGGRSSTKDRAVHNPSVPSRRRSYLPIGRSPGNSPVQSLKRNSTTSSSRNTLSWRVSAAVLNVDRRRSPTTPTMHLTSARRRHQRHLGSISIEFQLKLREDVGHCVPDRLAWTVVNRPEGVRSILADLRPIDELGFGSIRGHTESR